MIMIKLTGAVPDIHNNPTDERVEFQLHEDLIEMIYDGKYYFQIEDEGYQSVIFIDGKTFVDIRRVKGKSTSDLGAYVH